MGVSLILRHYDHKTNKCRLQRIVFETGAEVQPPVNFGIVVKSTSLVKHKRGPVLLID